VAMVIPKIPVAALPPDVRKAFGFPVRLDPPIGGYASGTSSRHSLSGNQLKQLRKGKAFPHIGRQAAPSQIIVSKPKAC
jgi:hypothetical protein